MSYIYHGPSGYNPDLGQISNGQGIEMPDELKEKFKKFLTKEKDKKKKDKEPKKTGDKQWPGME